MHTAEHATAIGIQHCIDECLGCYEVCVRTMEHWFELHGKRAGGSLIRTLSDCAAVCQASAGFMLRGSPFHARLCAICAEICREGERESSRVDGDVAMQRCAEACQRCAESCERMVNMAA